MASLLDGNISYKTLRNKDKPVNCVLDIDKVRDSEAHDRQNCGDHPAIPGTYISYYTLGIFWCKWRCLKIVKKK